MNRLVLFVCAFLLLVGVTATVSAQNGEAVVSRSPLNFRVAPSVNAGIITSFEHGSKYPVFAQSVSGYWYQLEAESVRGWVCASFVDFVGDVNAIPRDTSVLDEDCSGRTKTLTTVVNTDASVPTVVLPPQTPQVTIDSFPRYGSRGYLSGTVTGVDNIRDYKAACFLYRGGWYNKPYWARPDTYIGPNGRFSCYVNTGSGDQFATGFMVFIVPIGVETPLVGGGGIGSDFYSLAIAYTSVDRPAP
jgi:hypothetical protein